MTPRRKCRDVISPRPQLFSVPSMSSLPAAALPGSMDPEFDDVVAPEDLMVRPRPLPRGHAHSPPIPRPPGTPKVPSGSKYPRHSSFPPSPASPTAPFGPAPPRRAALWDTNKVPGRAARRAGARTVGALPRPPPLPFPLPFFPSLPLAMHFQTSPLPASPSTAMHLQTSPSASMIL